MHNNKNYAEDFPENFDEEFPEVFSDLPLEDPGYLSEI